MTATPQGALRIGTRGSPLALVQANETRRRLLAAHPGLREGDIELVVLKTSGDRIQDRSLADAGGKGLFTKELEEALLDGRIDMAVHSMKDVPTFLPDGLCIGCLLPREDPRDVLIANDATAIASLRPGAVIGTASLRRQAQLLHRRPDLKVVTFRGNVETRIRKLKEGQADATLLALAGLKRLGLAGTIGTVIEPAEILPAVAQGAIGIECRDGDRRTRDALAPLNDPDTADCVLAERAMLAVLDGSCRTPIAGLAELDGTGRLRLCAMLLKPDGSGCLEAAVAGPRGEAQWIGEQAGHDLKGRAGPGYF